MKHLVRPTLKIWIGVTLTTLMASATPSTPPPQPPHARQQEHHVTLHGQTLDDPFVWMRNRKDPEVLRYLKAENAYADGLLKPQAKLRSRLYAEMLSRVQEDDQRAPYKHGAYGYYARTEKGKAYAIYCRVPWGKTGPVETLLDLNLLAVGKPYLGLGDLEVSPDGKTLAYSLDTTGYRQYQLQFKDLRTGRIRSKSFPRVTSVAWSHDSKSIFFSTEDPTTKRSDTVWHYTLGKRQPNKLFYEKDDLFDVGCEPSRDESMVLVHSGSKTSAEVLFRPADGSDAPLQVLSRREPEHEYQADFFEGQFYIRSNRGGHIFRIFTSPQSAPDQWKQFYDPPRDTQLDGFSLFKTGTALLLRTSGVPELALMGRSGGPVRKVKFSEEVRSLSLAENAEADLDRVRVDYESPITPPITYDVELGSGKLHAVRSQPVPNYDKSKYRTERWWATARDGVKVPVTLTYRADLQADNGPHPLWLEAYGSYGVVDDPAFMSSVVSLLDRGVVYAWAHIRGGGDLGEEWRQAGRMFTKRTTFYDFEDCAEGLQKAGWTRPDQTVICGGSAGGLLMGVVCNERPDLFRAVVARVPFVDVMNTMLDASLPLTTSEYIEWGNPHEQPAFDYMRQYSPYDNVRAQAYPSMLVKVSLNDSQVPYWEGAKWIARLRQFNTGDKPLLLKSNLKAGHGGSSGRYARLQERAYDFAYALWQLGLTGQ